MGLSSCSSTLVTTRWQDPAAKPLHFDKVLTLCVAKGEEYREAVEGELCRYIPRSECKPAYFAIPDSMLSQPEQARALFRKEGFDGAVVFRVIGAQQRTTLLADGGYGGAYPTFWGYYDTAWDDPYDFEVYRTDEVVTVEVSIFSVADDRLIWTGTTETLDPTSLPKLVKEVSQGVRDELVRGKLVPPS